ncbi:MAG TPA: S41 family peptidase [Bacillales bacterium]|nr:S41 family peptidase [Bacillales bacterium]
MRLRKLTITLMLIASLLIGAGGTYFGMSLFAASSGQGTSEGHRQIESEENGGGKKAPEDNESKVSFEKVKRAYELITKNYYKEVDGDELINGAIQGMIDSLDDRFSVYMDPEAARQFTQSLSSSYQGIGAEVSMVNGIVTIMSPFKGSPADKAGLRANDQIISINGKSITGLDLYEAVQKIRGKKGTTVTLGIKREGSDEIMKVKVTRGEIPIETVHKDTVKKDGKVYGIIQITSFSEGTADEFHEALDALESQGIAGLVIDVRGNPGGYLGSVTKIADELIPNDEPIVQVVDRNGNKKRYFSNLEEKKEYPIVGLINGGSASAAEILSGALQEAGGYKLVGTKSFGKGTVQTEFNVGKGRLKLTIMKWLTPDGHWIHKKGLKPDISVKQPEYFYAHPITVEKGETLAYNENNDKVKNAQIMLEGLGFETGREDGYFGKQTVTAVKAFQNENGLSATGKIDKKTAKMLDQKILQAVDKKKNDLQLQTALGYLENQ